MLNKNTMENLLNNLPKIVEKRKKRLGRGHGSGRGAKSGRGTTRHQASRENIPLHFEGGQGRVVKKYPLLRGKGKNKSKQVKPIILKLSKLNIFNNDDIVTVDLLIEKKLVDVKARGIGVKIIDDGKKIEKKLKTKELEITSGVKRQIEAAGGTIEI